MRRHLSQRVRRAPRSLYPGVVQPRRAEVVAPRDDAAGGEEPKGPGARRTDGPLSPRRRS